MNLSQSIDEKLISINNQELRLKLKEAVVKIFIETVAGKGKPVFAK